jgi:hypothetical protein
MFGMVTGVCVCVCVCVCGELCFSMSNFSILIFHVPHYQWSRRLYMFMCMHACMYVCMCMYVTHPMRQLADAVAIYSLTPYLALCTGERCVLVRSSGLGLALSLSPPTSPRAGQTSKRGATETTSADSIHPAFVQLLMSESVVKMGMDVTPFIAGNNLGSSLSLSVSLSVSLFVSLSVSLSVTCLCLCTYVGMWI